MNVKGAFDHISRAKLARRMAELSIDDGLIGWTQLFLTDRLVEFVIDGYCNPRHIVESDIPQRSPVSPILFLIYISGVFFQVEEKISRVKCISFIDDLGFIICGQSNSKVEKLLEKAGRSALEWRAHNLVTYNTSKTEAILFSKARRQKLTKQLSET